MLKEQRHKFGQQRLWGTLGFSLTAIVTSVCVYVIKEQGQKLDYATMFYSHAAFCLASAVVAKFIAVSSDIRCGNVLKGACQLLTIPRVSVFLFVVFVFGVFYGSVTFVLWFIVELGAPPQLFGLCVVSSVILEVPTFFFSGRLIRRLGPVPCLCVSIATMSTRLLAYSLLGNPWLVLLIEPLHGVTFGLMLSSATTYASIVSPPGMSATTQGLVGGILFGSG
nr:hypothetical protein BaRGS_021046 [Batillaria attramentaria]